MRGRAGLIAASIVAAMGCAWFLAVKSGWVNYLWDRYAYDGVVQVAGHCYELPPRWTILPLPGDREDVVRVRRHFAGGGPEVLASLLPAKMVDGVRHMGKESSAPLNGGYTIYDLGTAAPVRYVAINENNETALTGERKDLLGELATGLTSCQR